MTRPNVDHAASTEDRLPTLHGASCVLRPTRPDDAERLSAILSEDEVARWWGEMDANRVRAELIDSEESNVFAVEVDGQLVGSVSYYEEPAPDYRHASVDVFLTTDWHGKGIGTDAVRTMVRHLIHDRGHHRISIDPAADNVKAIRAYERVGFKRVGVLRDYERGIDGSWHDCLLMDLLARDLR